MDRKQASLTREQHIQHLRQLRNQQAAFRSLPPAIPVAPTQPGLVNLGNTCYFNAVLQCLAHVPSLMQYLLGEGFVQDKLCFVNQNPLEMAFLSEFQNLVAAVTQSTARSIRPAELFKLLTLFHDQFNGGVQADAQECLTTILQILHNALKLNVKITIVNGAGTSASFDQLRKGFKQYQSHLSHDGYSAIDEMFGSQFESRLTCAACGHSWSSFDPYSLVPVEIAPKALTLYDCLDQFMAAEVLDDVQCDRCACKRQCTKQFKLWTLPKVMIIQLKRFDHLMRKVTHFVQAPKVLNLSQYVSHPKVHNVVNVDPSALQLFALKGIVCHAGQLHGGHYIAKCAVHTEWLEFNDESVTRISEDTLQSANNYILFYEMSAQTKTFWHKHP